MAMSPRTARAYLAWRRACDAADNRALSNRAEHISTFNKRNARIARLKARYEDLLREDRSRETSR